MPNPKSQPLFLCCASLHRADIEFLPDPAGFLHDPNVTKFAKLGDFALSHWHLT